MGLFWGYFGCLNLKKKYYTIALNVNMANKELFGASYY